mmetsp:Transcript_21824/g.33173  ORF Transcript_21824/g.33173 Transcript_21824/m.33173 type:complete len:192 (-) Transcript_21824:281-856(-)|eukprot:CAMPEP_0194102580 /NCGR_PEP_ID=MMETSP0150-20130528/3182_1 /TAXON_ID=122233 /ORGANISM="Chaetoceros debilis, Strain MM31A-1" /LENGTH=191 /DNA_ID=CAMNT_0038789593 /DNA_START=87 /DNA_END=662 /DNA_ORIENTATION=-
MTTHIPTTMIFATLSLFFLGSMMAKKTDAFMTPRSQKNAAIAPKRMNPSTSTTTQYNPLGIYHHEHPLSSTLSPLTDSFYKNLQDYEIDAGKATSLDISTNAPVLADTNANVMAVDMDVDMDMDIDIINLPRSTFLRKMEMQKAKDLKVFLSLEIFVGRIAIVSALWLFTQEAITGVPLSEQLQRLVGGGW